MKIDVKELTKITLKEDEVLLIELPVISLEEYDYIKKDIKGQFKKAGLRDAKIILSTIPMKLTKIKEKGK